MLSATQNDENRLTMTFQLQVAEHSTGNGHLALLRWSMVLIFLWFGTQKFTPYAAHEIAPLMLNSPFMSWLMAFGEIGAARIVGTIELITATLLIIGTKNPVASALGAALASGTFVLTISFIFTTPGITLKNPTGFPPISSSLVEMFLIKDIGLLGSCLTLLVASLAPGRKPVASVA
jgi:uncharacterized membrane protein YkgB